ncbi:hypothetical protein OCU04_004800 [Sclerotinia nivalis]|uniref:Uncharacterized protein n=1 Tax=Sclerotinia nivalis TaxID=352851 RepID=A0A9X0DMC1_9HELO|nr:hypothetical protein OCU04_004800 [Sclerotinia nivalis]
MEPTEKESFVTLPLEMRLNSEPQMSDTRLIGYQDYISLGDVRSSFPNNNFCPSYLSHVQRYLIS